MQTLTIDGITYTYDDMSYENNGIWTIKGVRALTVVELKELQEEQWSVTNLTITPKTGSK
jgi:hypothetical protein